MTMLLAFLMFLMPSGPGPGYLVGGPGTLHVHDYGGKAYCAVRIADAGDSATIDAKACKTLGDFAKAVKITGNYARQHYLDAAGAEVAWGTQKEDGYWFYTPDGKRYYLDTK